MRTLSALALVLSIVGLACADGGAAPEGEVVHTSLGAAETNRRLEAAAAALAPALADPLLRSGLGSALAERPTGDFEVMVRNVRQLPLSDGRTLGDVLARSDVEAIDLVHVAAPGGIPVWGEQPVLVTFVPVGEEAITELVYFDVAGVRQVAPAESRPEAATIIVGINERTDPAPVAAGDDVATKTSALTSCTAGSCRKVYLKRLKITDTSEPWYKGDPEIYTICADQGADIRGIFMNLGEIESTGLNDVNVWHATCSIGEANLGLCDATKGNVLLTDLTKGHPAQCYLMERDGGLSEGSMDMDDILGTATIYFEDTPTRYYQMEKGTFDMR